MEQTPSKSQHTKSTLEKKIVPPLLPGFELATFRHESGALTNKLSRLPLSCLLLYMPDRKLQASLCVSFVEGRILETAVLKLAESSVIHHYFLAVG